MSNFILRVLQGTLIGLGAVLPGISGGVLCVIFGVYTIIMEFLADPFRKLKRSRCCADKEVGLDGTY